MRYTTKREPVLEALMLDPVLYLLATLFILAIVLYFLRADPDEVEKERKEFRDRLYQRDALQTRTSRH